MLEGEVMTFIQPTPPASPRRRLTDHDPAARQRVDLVATARIEGDAVCDRICRVQSLSLGGAFVELDRMPMGSVVNLTFSVPQFDDKLSLDGVVQWSDDDGVSVLFDSLRATDVWILWQFLARSARDAAGGDPTRRDHLAAMPRDTPTSA